jgi:enamine deaminase RidA (YjgF/YER057c/UK114 family)
MWGSAMLGIERDDPFGGAWGAALGVRAGDFVFTTVAGVEGLDEGEPVFPRTLNEQLDLVGENLVYNLKHFDCPLESVVDATVWVHLAVALTPGQFLDALQEHVFHGVMPTIAVVRSEVLYPDALAALHVVAYAPLTR